MLNIRINVAIENSNKGKMNLQNDISNAKEAKGLCLVNSFFLSECRSSKSFIM